MPAAYIPGFCPVCGFPGGDAYADDYLDCPCCNVDYCYFVIDRDDPEAERSAWLGRIGLTPSAFYQLVRNLGVAPDRPQSWPELLYDAALGYEDAVKRHLDHGSDPNVVNERGESPLFFAALMERLSIMEMLIERGADVNLAAGPDPLNDEVAPGATALHWAATTGANRSIQRLVAAGANVEQSAQDGSTPLHRAATALKPETVDLLISLGHTVDVYLTSGERPLNGAHRYWKYGFYDLRIDSRETASSIVQMLLKAGADPSVSARRWSSPIETAIEVQDMQLIEALLDAGASADTIRIHNPHTEKIYLQCPVGLAAGNAGTEQGLKILRRILEEDVDVNAWNSFGSRPLSSAFIEDHWEAAELLLEAGANPLLDEQDHWGPIRLLRSSRTIPEGWVEKWIISRTGADVYFEKLNYKATPEDLKKMEDINNRLLNSDDDSEELPGS